MKQQNVTMKKIGDTKFYIRPFGAFTSARVSADLAAILSPLLECIAPLMSGRDGDSDNAAMNTDMDVLLPALSDGLSKLSGEQLEYLARLLMVDYKNVSYENENGDVELLDFDAANEIFCCDFMGMILLGWEVVKLNFNGFFARFADLFGGLRGTTAGTAAVSMLGTKSGGNST